MWVSRTRQCERARELAALRLDGEISELEDALLRTHQERCPECRAFAAGIEGFTTVLRAAPLERPRPVGLPRRTRTALRSVQFAAAAAAIAVVAGVGSMLAMLSSPASQSRLPEISGSFRNDDLAEVRRLRRNELVFRSEIISPRTSDERIIRLS
jgi:hypothetical protein